MAKTLDEIAEEIVENMNQEDLKKAAKLSIMISYRLIDRTIQWFNKEKENGQEK